MLFSNSRVAVVLFVVGAACGLVSTQGAQADDSAVRQKQLLDSGLYHQAVLVAQNEIKKDPRCFDCYCNRALGFMGLKRYRKAIEDYNNALAIQRDATVLHNRGVAQSGLGNYQQAIKDFGDAIAVNPVFPEAYCSRGKAYMAAGNYQAATDDFAQALLLKDDYAEAYFLRGINYLAMQDRQHAAEDFDQAHHLNARYGELINALCDAADSGIK